MSVGGAQARSPEEILLGFCRALRAAGVVVTADRERSYLAAVAEVGLGDVAATRYAGRATLCASPADLERHDLVFAAWFAGIAGPPVSPAADHPTSAVASLTDSSDPSCGQDQSPPEPVRATASRTEVLRRADVASMSARDRADLAALLRRLRPTAPHRRSRRLCPGPRGRLDPARTLRATARRMGEPGEMVWRRRRTTPRRVVLLIDVSGSMALYADALLRLAHAWTASGAPVETFTIGTRLTHVTRPLRQRDADRALIACGQAVPDWSGGTRLADGVRTFLRQWGRRGLARGAVVVIMSDGWERGDPADLSAQLESLRALAHRVVWANPHRGRPGYQPLQGGIIAALPHLDAFVAGHSLAAFEELMEVVAHA